MAWRFGPILKAAPRLCLALLLTQPAQQAAAYPTPVDFDGTLLRWDISKESPPITYEIVTDPPDDSDALNEAVDRSADMWSNIASSYFRLQRAGAEKDAQITVRLERTLDGGDYSAGYAVFDEYLDRVPVHCSIHVGVGSHPSYTALSKTILHELGHCIGLGHTLIPEAIMSYSLAKNRYALDVDDIAAVTRLYPANGAPPELPPGCAVGAPHTPQSLAMSWLALSLPLAVAFRRQKARTKKVAARA